MRKSHLFNIFDKLEAVHKLCRPKIRPLFRRMNKISVLQPFFWYLIQEFIVNRSFVHFYEDCRYPVRRQSQYDVLLVKSWMLQVIWSHESKTSDFKDFCSMNDLTSKISYWDCRSHRICIVEKYNQAIIRQKTC